MKSCMKNILFKNTNKFVIEKGSVSDNSNMRMALTLNRNLEKYGYTLDTAALNVLSTQNAAEMTDTWTDLLASVRKITGADVFENKELFYPNFPEEVMGMDEADLYVNSLFYYTFSQTNNEAMLAIADAIRNNVVEKKKERLPLMEEFPRELRIINLGTEDDLFKMMDSRIHSLNMSDTQYEELCSFSDEYKEKFDEMIGSETPFQSKETKVKIAMMLHESERDKEVGLMLKDSVDILRYAAMISKKNGIEWNNIELLSKKAYDNKSNTVKEKEIAFKLNKAEQRQIKSLLNNCKNLYEDIWRQEKLFKNLMNRIAPTAKGGCPTRVIKAFDNLAHNKKLTEDGTSIYSFENELNKIIAKKDANAILELANFRPGDYLRHYISAVYKMPTEEMRQNAMDAIRCCENSTSISLRDMLTLKNVIEMERERQHSIDNGDGAIRIYAYGKGKQHIDGDIEKMAKRKLPDDVYDEMIRTIQKTAENMVANHQNLGKIYIDPMLSNNKAPGRNMRDASDGSMLVPFSVVDADKNKNLIILGCNWGAVCMNGRIDNRYVDIDLAAHFYGKNYEDMGVISYYNLIANVGCHSGDYTFVPEGGTSTEAILFDKSKLREYGVAYVTAEVHCYSIKSFKEANNCSFIMEQREGRVSDADLKKNDKDDGTILFNGEVFDPSTVDFHIKLTSDASSAAPCVYDVEADKFYWLDFDMKQLLGRPSISHSTENMSNFMIAIERAKHNPYPDMAELFSTFAVNNGTLATDIKDADTIFVAKPIDREKMGISEEARIITAYDLDVISKEFSGNNVVVPVEKKEEKEEEQKKEVKEHPLVRQLKHIKEKI